MIIENAQFNHIAIFKIVFLLFFLELKHHKTKQKRTKTKKMRGIKWIYAEFFKFFLLFLLREEKNDSFSSNPLLFSAESYYDFFFFFLFSSIYRVDGMDEMICQKHFDQWGSVYVCFFFMLLLLVLKFSERKKTYALTVTLR